MKQIRIAFAAFMLVAAIGLAVPAQAESVANGWESVEFPIFGDPCGGEDVLIQGMLHETISTLRNGQFSIHINAQGVITGLDTGREWLWRFNITEVVPIADGNSVSTFRQTDKVIGRGGLPSLFINYKFHITEINGDVKVYFDSGTYDCKD